MFMQVKMHFTELPNETFNTGSSGVTSGKNHLQFK